jgi:hypothetical protein
LSKPEATTDQVAFVDALGKRRDAEHDCAGER